MCWATFKAALSDMGPVGRGLGKCGVGERALLVCKLDWVTLSGIYPDLWCTHHAPVSWWEPLTMTIGWAFLYLYWPAHVLPARLQVD